MTYTIQANTADELKAAAPALLSDDELLEALRKRMRPRGLIVQVEEFDLAGALARLEPGDD